MSVKIVSLPDNFLYFCREKTGSVGSYPADELNSNKNLQQHSGWGN